MALINCAECQTEISGAALTCPKCGVQLRKPKRGFFGQIIKWSFIGFNILMAWWLVSGMATVTQGTEAISVGGAIGAGIGAALILGIWVAGDIILGLLVVLTRPKL